MSLAVEQSVEDRIKQHRAESRDEAGRNPSAYLSGYPNLSLHESERVAVMVRSDVARLNEYSASVPTGVYVDKCWLFARPEAGDRFDVGKKLWLRVYRETDPPSPELKIVSYRIVVCK